jgi:hypothetical protein
VPAPNRADLIAHLTAARIAGHVATPRENNLANYRRMSEREPLYLLGLELDGAWTPGGRARDDGRAVRRVAGSRAHARFRHHRPGAHRSSRLDAMAARLRLAADRRERVLVATGHPVGMRPVHTGNRAGVAGGRL